jgi:hypothetical protein
MAVKTFAPGNAPNTGAPGPTPAPKKALQPNSDQITSIRKAPVAGYGQDRSQSPSSIPPGTNLLSPMAQSLKAAQDDGEGTLDKIISGDHAAQVRDLGRTVSDTQYPTTFGHRSRKNDVGNT